MNKRERRGPLKLLHGDIVIATAIAHFPPHIGNGRQSQDIGDIMIVNNPFECGRVQGNSLMPGIEGLGTSLAAGTYRLAKPSDKHYVMTVHEWDRYQFERLVRAIWFAPFTLQLAVSVLASMWLLGTFQ